MKTVFILISCCWYFFHSELTAQEAAMRLGEQSAPGRLISSSGFNYEFNRLQLADEQVILMPVKGGNERKLTLAEVIQVETLVGNYAAEYGLLGGGSALLGSFLGIVQAENQSGIKADGGPKTVIMMSLTGVGVLIGVLVGQKRKKYRTVYRNPAFN